MLIGNPTTVFIVHRHNTPVNGYRRGRRYAWHYLLILIAVNCRGDAGEAEHIDGDQRVGTGESGRTVRRPATGMQARTESGDVAACVV